jgi:predicted RNA polymerase sigma factor
MDSTRKYRLLLLASRPRYNHKKRYPEYLKLLDEGLVGWQLGTAFLTEKGKQELEIMRANRKIDSNSNCGVIDYDL